MRVNLQEIRRLAEWVGAAKETIMVGEKAGKANATVDVMMRQHAETKALRAGRKVLTEKTVQNEFLDPEGRWEGRSHGN